MIKTMLSIDHQNHRSRVLIHNTRVFRGFSYTYHKLPKSLLKLSVLKLDGSSFGVEISMNATVGELKLALEEVFNVLPNEERCIISWAHVWGHFCLSYEGQKLLNDKAYIRRLGIKDGDQVKFVRHVTVNYKPTRQGRRKLSHVLRPHSMLKAQEGREQTEANDHDHVEDQETDFHYYQCEEEEAIFLPESKHTNFLKGWLSLRKFRR